jgi:aminoglycoside phosphotransferase (APT) family kinase protein
VSEDVARRALGIAGPLELLRASGGAVYRAAEGIVRVAVGGAEQVRVAAALHAAGAPVPALLAAPVAWDGKVVTLWEDVPDDAGAEPALLGAALARFHAVGGALLAAHAISVPPWEPLGWLDRWLARATVDAGLRRELETRAAALAPALEGDTTLLHTDAHRGNFRARGDRAVLVDLESLAIGPALYDLVPMEVTERRFRGAGEYWRAFAIGAGADPDDPRLAPLVALREVLAVGFVLGLGHREVARARLADLDRPHARWTPY